MKPSPPRPDEAAVIGNERLTALASGVLLVLLLVELATIANLHALLPVHVLVGVLLAGPLAVKLGSTGYRFLRYYTGSPAFVRRGPPRRLPRVLAPLLLAATIVVLGSGMGLLVIGPTPVGPLRAAHFISTVIWIPLFAVHVAAYVRRAPRRIADDWGKRPAGQAPGRGRRLGAVLGASLAGAIAATLALPFAGPWLAWIETNEAGPGPLIVGLILATLALAGARPRLEE